MSKPCCWNASINKLKLCYLTSSRYKHKDFEGYNEINVSCYEKNKIREIDQNLIYLLATLNNIIKLAGIRELRCELL
jgi:hypothetical protein